MTRAPSICGIIIASGAYPPFSNDLALQTWPPGDLSSRQSYLGAHISGLQSHTDLVIVVVGRNADRLASTIYSKAAFLTVNPAPELGPFSSLKLGLQGVLGRGRDAAFISYANRPPVMQATRSRIHGEFLAAINDNLWAAVPQFENQFGAPYLVGREMIEAFLRAPLTSAERDVLAANSQHVRAVPLDDPAITMHVETAEDYQRLIQSVP